MTDHEKLISPLAIRFSQKCIQATFKDGHSLKRAIQGITERPGFGDYDVMLQFPFRPIEIFRWCPPHCKAAKLSAFSHNQIGEEPEGTHWFTLDNRRLFCLQCAATACWPRRVAIAVEVLCTPPITIHSKYDSTSYGCSVDLVHFTTPASAANWDWRSETLGRVDIDVENLSPELSLALDAILSDDEKDSGGALLTTAGRSGPALFSALKTFGMPGTTDRTRGESMQSDDSLSSTEAYLTSCTSLSADSRLGTTHEESDVGWMTEQL